MTATKLAGQVAVVTGAGQGIGRGIALALAAEGARVVIATLIAEEAAETEALITAAGGEALAVQTDVSDEASVKTLFEQVAAQCGALHTLVNNAGITRFKPIFEATLDDWETVVGTNLRGTFLCTKYAAELMRVAGGSVINISSNHALATIPNAEIYAASKGGINALTRGLAISLGSYGIRVNAIMPGFTTTPHYYRWLGNKPGLEQAVMGLHPTANLTSPTDIGNLAVYLASDDSRSMTGAELLVDNGLSAQLYTGSL